ncbi:proline-rich receptor-like protein kinase PERK12 [Iris pallida]|uniref:Proline-rich receptor-like protein kinase PERK12 n=1 Tax=Iris pallida TaxID=29817 RepID=A0AAX6FXM6_IRIPA|nr:proline-rich receptor-like protein kinase PERK12 [Iris pallida]
MHRSGFSGSGEEMARHIAAAGGWDLATEVGGGPLEKRSGWPPGAHRRLWRRDETEGAGRVSGKIGAERSRSAVGRQIREKRARWRQYDNPMAVGNDLRNRGWRLPTARRLGFRVSVCVVF